MTGDGVVNFMTARRTYNVWLDDFGTPVVMTVGAPLFYWFDLNGNGEFETGKVRCGRILPRMALPGTSVCMTPVI